MPGLLEKYEEQKQMIASRIPAAAQQPTYGSDMGFEGAVGALVACTTSWPNSHVQLLGSWLRICAYEPLYHLGPDAFDTLLCGTKGSIAILQTCHCRLS